MDHDQIDLASVWRQVLTELGTRTDSGVTALSAQQRA